MSVGIRFGMCGAGGMGRHFAALLGIHPRVASVTVADPNPDVRDAVAQLPGIDATVDSLDRLLATDVQCVGIFSPPWLHADQSIQALTAGRHVLGACPAALDLTELRALVGAVEASGHIYMTAETSYYYPGAMFARKAWADGRFGEFVYGEGEYYFRPHAYQFWLRDHYANMPSMLYPTHSTTMVVSVTGKRFERVTCVGMPGLHPDAVDKRRRPEWAENETTNMTMLARMSGGGACRINEMRNVGCAGELGSIIGTHGAIRQHADRAVWTNGLRGDEGECIDLTHRWQDPAQHPQTALAARLPAAFEGRGLEHWGSHRFLVDEFVRAVTEDRRPHNHVWAAARYCAPGIVAWDSVQQDSAWLEVPDFGMPSDARDPLPW
jgi:predicted dehydrogenase